MSHMREDDEPAPEGWPSRFRRADQKQRELDRKCRAAYIAGAEDRSRRAHGRWLTDEELRAILATYPRHLVET
jgi:hypothetical protein